MAPQLTRRLSGRLQPADVQVVCAVVCWAKPVSRVFRMATAISLRVALILELWVLHDGT